MDKYKSFVPLASIIVLAFVFRGPVTKLVDKWTTPTTQPTAQQIKAAWEKESARVAALEQEHKAAKAALASLTGSAPESPSAAAAFDGTSGTSATPTPVFVYQPGTAPDFLPWPSNRPPLIAPSDFDGKLRDVSTRAHDYYPGLPAGVVYDCHIVVEPGRHIWIDCNGFSDPDRTDRSKAVNTFMLPVDTDNSKQNLPMFRIMDVVSEDETPVKFTLEFSRRK